MDYDKFKEEYVSFDNWYNDGKYNDGILGSASNDVITFSDRVLRGPFGSSDSVNSPSHYTRGKAEAIDVIEDAIQDAPSPKDGMLQAQALKYLLRLWLKADPEEDAKKARWYLNRLITSLES